MPRQGRRSARLPWKAKTRTPKEKNPRSRNPGGPTGYTRGEGWIQYASAATKGQANALNVNGRHSVSIWRQLVPRVRSRLDGERQCRDSLKGHVGSPERQCDGQGRRWRQSPCSDQRRHKIAVATDEDHDVTGVLQRRFDEVDPERNVGLLLFESGEAATAVRTRQMLGLEATQAHVHARGSEGRQIVHLPSPPARSPVLQVVGESGEVHDLRLSAPPRQYVEVRSAQGGDIEPMKRLPKHSLRVEERMVKVEAVDEEDGAVDDGPPERTNPRGRNPGGPTEHAPWGGY